MWAVVTVIGMSLVKEKRNTVSDISSNRKEPRRPWKASACVPVNCQTIAAGHEVKRRENTGWQKAKLSD